MANIVYLIRETSHITWRNWLTETGIDSFIKYLMRPICGDFCCREGISCVNSNVKDSRDCSALFFYFYIKIIYFYLLREWNKVSRKFSWRFLKRCVYLLKDGVLLFSQIFRRKFYLRWCKNIRCLLKIKR